MNNPKFLLHVAFQQELSELRILGRADNRRWGRHPNEPEHQKENELRKQQKRALQRIGMDFR